MKQSCCVPILRVCQQHFELECKKFGMYGSIGGQIFGDLRVMKAVSPFYHIYKVHSTPHSTRRQLNPPFSSRLFPTCCTCHAAPTSNALALFSNSSIISRGAIVDSYLRQIDIGHNDAVQSTWSVLRRVLWVSTWMILVPAHCIRKSLVKVKRMHVLEVVSGLITLRAACLPWHAALRNINLRLGGSGCRLAAYMKVNRVQLKNVSDVGYSGGRYQSRILQAQKLRT